MVSIAAYDRVVSAIYESALVPSQWSFALSAMISAYAPRDWEVAFLLWERLSPPAGRFLGTAGVNDMAHDIYLKAYAGANEWSVGASTLQNGQTVRSEELITREDFFQTSLYRDFLSHWGYGSAIISMLDRHGFDQLGLVLSGPAEREPDALMEVVPLLLPHFQRAARISRRIGEADLRAATAESLLNGSPYAVFALGPDLRFLLANARGQALLESHDGLRLNKGRLLLGDAGHQAELLAMSQEHGRPRTYSLSLDDAAGKKHIFTALSVMPALSDQFANPALGATLMLIGGQRVGISGDLVAQLEQAFGFTASEARLAGHILEGTGLEGYMRDRSVSMNAARFLLRSIYDKTGVNNHIALSALLRESPLGWGGADGQKGLSPPDGA